jgi:hypothetical protein
MPLQQVFFKRKRNVISIILRLYCLRMRIVESIKPPCPANIWYIIQQVKFTAYRNVNAVGSQLPLHVGRRPSRGLRRPVRDSQLASRPACCSFPGYSLSHRFRALVVAGPRTPAALRLHGHWNLSNSPPNHRRSPLGYMSTGFRSDCTSSTAGRPSHSDGSMPSIEAIIK